MNLNDLSVWCKRLKLMAGIFQEGMRKLGISVLMA